MAELLRKISVATVLGESPDVPKDGEKVFLFRVWGAAGRFKVHQSEKGDSVGLLGQFRAKRADGVEFDAGTLWMPRFVSEPIAAALQAEETKSVEFAFDVYVKGDKTSITNYTYIYERVIEPDAETDPLSKMEKSFPKALPAPAKKK
jgi:hypothetical protein